MRSGLRLVGKGGPLWRMVMDSLGGLMGFKGVSRPFKGFVEGFKGVLGVFKGFKGFKGFKVQHGLETDDGRQKVEMGKTKMGKGREKMARAVRALGLWGMLVSPFLVGVRGGGGDDGDGRAAGGWEGL